MDRLHKIHFAERKANLTDIHGPGERLTRKQTTSRPDNEWTDMWKHMSDAAKSKAKQKWAVEKPKLDNARQLRGVFFIEPNDEKINTPLKNACRKLEIPMPAAMPCENPIRPRCGGQTVDAISAYTQVEMEDAPSHGQNFKIGMSRYLGTSYQSTNCQNHGPVWKIRLFLLSEICTVILWEDCHGKGNSRRVLFEYGWKKFRIGIAYLLNRSLSDNKDYPYLCNVDWNWGLRVMAGDEGISVECGYGQKCTLIGDLIASVSLGPQFPVLHRTALAHSSYMLDWDF